MMRCLKLAKTLLFQVCEVAVAVMETTQLVLSQSKKNFYRIQLRVNKVSVHEKCLVDIMNW